MGEVRGKVLKVDFPHSSRLWKPEKSVSGNCFGWHKEKSAGGIFFIFPILTRPLGFSAIHPLYAISCRFATSFLTQIFKEFLNKEPSLSQQNKMSYRFLGLSSYLGFWHCFLPLRNIMLEGSIPSSFALLLSGGISHVMVWQLSQVEWWYEPERENELKRTKLQPFPLPVFGANFFTPRPCEAAKPGYTLLITSSTRRERGARSIPSFSTSGGH